MMKWTQAKEPVAVETAVLRELSLVAVVVLQKYPFAQGGHQAAVKAVEAECSDLMLTGQQCNAVAVVLVAEVLVEVAAAAAVVTAVAVASVVVAAAAAVTAAKAEELSVKFAEPFDGKMNKSNTQKLDSTTVILGITTCSYTQGFQVISSSRTFQEPNFVFEGPRKNNENDSIIAYTVIHIVHVYHNINEQQ